MVINHLLCNSENQLFYKRFTGVCGNWLLKSEVFKNIISKNLAAK